MTLVLSRSPWIVRSFAPGDEPTLREAADDWEVAKWLRDAFPHPYTDDDARDWISYAGRQEPQTELAILEPTPDGPRDGRVIGSVGFRLQEDMYRHTAEVGYWVARSHWGRGVATATLRVTVAHAFESFPLRRLFAGVKEGNEGSIRVLEKLGFRLEGRCRGAVIDRSGDCKDELLFGLLRDDWQATP